MEPIGSWNLPQLRDPSGQQLIPQNMWVVVSQDSGPLDINKLPKRIQANVVWDATNAGRSRLDFYETGIPGLAFNCDLWVKAGRQMYFLAFRCDLPTGTQEAVGPPTHPCIDPTPFPNMQATSDSFKFPRDGSARASLLPGEAGDDFGDVYIDPPPEFYAQAGARPQAAHVDLIRGDAFTYVTPFAPADINPACDTAWLVSIGQNTNFGNRMWYTPLLPLYPGDVQDAFLADYAKYNTHVMLQGSLDQALVRVTCQKARAAGLYAFVFDWTAATFSSLADCIDGAIIGLEVDKMGSGRIAAGELDALIADTCAVCVPKGIRVWLHFTSSGGPSHVQHWAFPSGGMSYTNWWEQNDRLGVAGLMYESFMDYNGDMDSAGKMGAMMFYARQGLHFSSNCLICACEIMSAPPFMGLVDGPFAWRRSAEMVCCPNGGIDNMAGVAGSFNGGMQNIATGDVL